MNILLAITPDMYSKVIIDSEVAGPMETLAFGAMILGIGLLAVFSVLCLLWGALALFKVAFYDLPAKKKTAAEAPEVPAPVAPVVATAPTVSEDEELITVFAAAIAMAESESVGAKFRVVSFKRK